jgi:CDGSH-type Zn-finger protein
MTALLIAALRDTVRAMSTEPVIAARAPAKVMLEAGKDYWFCACGRSATQPFCNGAHKGSGFAPQKFTAEKSGDVWLCQCKHSKIQPYCDGTHKTLKA